MLEHNSFLCQQRWPCLLLKLTEQCHELIKSTLNHQESNVPKLISKLTLFTTPFDEDTNELINLVQNVVMPAMVKNDILWAHDVGYALYDGFIAKHITATEINLWSPKKKSFENICGL